MNTHKKLHKYCTKLQNDTQKKTAETLSLNFAISRQKNTKKNDLSQTCQIEQQREQNKKHMVTINNKNDSNLLVSEKNTRANCSNDCKNIKTTLLYQQFYRCIKNRPITRFNAIGTYTFLQ